MRAGRCRSVRFKALRAFDLSSRSGRVYGSAESELRARTILLPAGPESFSGLTQDFVLGYSLPPLSGLVRGCESVEQVSSAQRPACTYNLASTKCSTWNITRISRARAPAPLCPF